MSVKSSETVVDDWEGIDDSELDTKLDELKKNVTNAKSSTMDNGRATFNVMLLDDDECMRTQYVPPEPTVKILKRPSNEKSKEQLLAESRPKAPIKTLQQREQEYAQARLRILGSAKSADDDELESAIIENRNGSGTSGTSATNGSIADNFTNRSPSYGRINSNAGGTSNSPNNTRRNGTASSQLSSPNPLELRRIEDNVIRLPRGPDGTAGFMLKR